MNSYSNELLDLCLRIKELTAENDLSLSKKIIYQAMSEYPDNPEPHNLLGLVLEKENNHVLAMKHFRAALDLDETYYPARENLNKYGTFHSNGSDCFSSLDCKTSETLKYEIKYDSHGIGCVTRRR